MAAPSQQAHVCIHEGAQGLKAGGETPKTHSEEQPPPRTATGVPQPHGLETSIPTRPWELLQLTHHRGGHCLGQGMHCGMQRKSIPGLHRTDYGMLRVGTSSGEREGSRWFGKKRTQKDRRVRGLKGWAMYEQWLVSTLIWLCPAPH